MPYRPRMAGQQVVYRTRQMQAIEAERGRSLEDILRELYVDRGLTLEEVGSDLGITAGAASRWCERFGIPLRRPGPRAVA
jgi:hypothetical protein